jgi:hypothetical protein
MSGHVMDDDEIYDLREQQDRESGGLNGDEDEEDLEDEELPNG